MAAQWNTYFLEPLAIGGAARLSASVVDAVSGLPADAVLCFLGPVAAVSAQDTNPALVLVPLGPSAVGGWSGNVFGAPRVAGQVLSWFCEFGGVWSAGPVVSGVDLSSPSPFPTISWVLDWIVDRLQEFAADNPLSANRNLAVRRTFPRDTNGWPMISVQVDQISPSGSILAESEGAPNPTVGSPLTEGRVFGLSLSLVGWASNPEDRSLITPWLVSALTPLVDVCAFVGMSEPSFSVSESEDFETIGVPAFISTATWNCQIESRWARTLRSGYGSISL